MRLSLVAIVHSSEMLPFLYLNIFFSNYHENITQKWMKNTQQAAASP